MRLKLVCAVSLLLNAALAGYWLKSRSGPAVPELPVSASATSLRQSAVPASSVPALAPSPVALPPTVSPWSRIESTDFAVFIANLRATGCPERTVRDLVVPEIERLYADPETPAPGGDDFWWPKDRRETHWHSLRLERLRREADRRAHVRALLGVDGIWPDDHRHSLQQWGGICALLTPPSFEAAEQFAWLLDRTEFENTRIKALADSPLKLSEIDELKRLRDGSFSQAVSLVGQARVDETLGLIRVVMGAFQALDFMDSRDPALRISEAEMRRLVAAQPKEMSIVDEAFGFEEVTRLERFRAGRPKDASDEEKASFLGTLVPALGEVRARELALRSMPDWSDLAEFAKERDLPETTTILLVEARELAKAEARRIRETPTLTAEEEVEQLKQIGEELRSSLGDALPADAWSDYLNEHGEWIQALETGVEDDE